MDKGYILVSRAILDSDVFASQKLLKIWIWCLCKANFKDRFVPLKIGKGETTVSVKRGSFIFGRHKAEEELFIDGSTIYKSIKKLAEMDMIKIESNNQYSIVTICKYNDYQDNSKYKLTSKEQPSNNQVTAEEQPSNTTNTLPNVKKDNNVKQLIDRKAEFKNSLLPFLDEYGKDLLNDFFAYWTEHGDKDKKMRFEKEKSFGISRRLSTWKKRETQFNKNNSDGSTKSRREKFIESFKN